MWQAAIDLAVRTYEMTHAPEFRRRYSLRDQIERGVVSVSNNRIRARHKSRFTDFSLFCPRVDGGSAVDAVHTGKDGGFPESGSKKVEQRLPFLSIRGNLLVRAASTFQIY